jgi:hypothetical protein
MEHSYCNTILLLLGDVASHLKLRAEQLFPNPSSPPCGAVKR